MLALLGSIGREYAVALKRSFQPHKDNNNRRKIITLIAVGVWAIITLGIAFGYAQRTDVYGKITYVVVAILFEQIGQEKQIYKQESDD